MAADVRSGESGQVRVAWQPQCCGRADGGQSQEQPWDGIQGNNIRSVSTNTSAAQTCGCCCAVSGLVLLLLVLPLLCLSCSLLLIQL
jgi:hypothetical protein